MTSPQPPTDPPTKTKPLARLRDYELLSRLGRGGMGTVYLAHHVHLEKLVAIKLLPREHTRKPEMVARFKREMKAVGKLHHPNLVQAHDAGELRGVHYLVMEYLEGLNLATLVQRNGPLSIADACEIVRQATLGLDHAHRHGLVHRDIKPSNLLLSWPRSVRGSAADYQTAASDTPAPETAVYDGQASSHSGSQQPLVKILDLGLALLHSDQETVGGELTHSQQIMGTVDYMAPEQSTNTHAVDIRADIYSLGCTLFTLLSGRAPFADHNESWQKLSAHNNTPPPPIRDLRTEVPEPLDAILQRMLAKRPEQRYQTPRELSAALEPFCQHHTLVATLVHAEALQAEHQARVDAATRSLHQSALSDTKGARPEEEQTRDDELLELIRAALQPEQPSTAASGELEATQPLTKADASTTPRTLTRWWLAVGGTTALGIALAVILWTQFNAGKQSSPLAPREASGLANNPSTSLNSNAQNTVPSGTADISRSEMATLSNPSPLDEWLKGRKILTVKQDGSAMFTTIQDALKALKPGEAVEVLDKGPYVETLTMDPVTNRSLPNDTGLVSRVRTELKVPEWLPFPDEHGPDNASFLCGHSLVTPGNFRLHGIVFASQPVLGGRELFVNAHQCVIEDCDFVAYAAAVNPQHFRNLQSGFWGDNLGECSLVIRNCNFGGMIHVGMYQRTPVGVTTIVLRQNVFHSPTDELITFFKTIDQRGRLLLIENVTGGAATTALAMGAIQGELLLDVASNTHLSRRFHTFGSNLETSVQLTSTRNIVLGKAFHLRSPALESQGPNVAWLIEQNAYPQFPDGDYGLISAEKNFIGPIGFLSTDPNDQNYLRLKPDSPLAKLPPDTEGRAYVGALPPGPPPAEGDWFTRLMDRWHDAQ